MPVTPTPTKRFETFRGIFHRLVYGLVRVHIKTTSKSHHTSTTTQLLAAFTQCRPARLLRSLLSRPSCTCVSARWHPKPHTKEPENAIRKERQTGKKTTATPCQAQQHVSANRTCTRTARSHDGVDESFAKTDSHSAAQTCPRCSGESYSLPLSRECFLETRLQLIFSFFVISWSTWHHAGKRDIHHSEWKTNSG